MSFQKFYRRQLNTAIHYIYTHISFKDSASVGLNFIQWRKHRSLIRRPKTSKSERTTPSLLSDLHQTRNRERSRRSGWAPRIRGGEKAYWCAPLAAHALPAPPPLGSMWGPPRAAAGSPVTEAYAAAAHAARRGGAAVSSALSGLRGRYRTFLA